MTDVNQQLSEKMSEMVAIVASSIADRLDPEMTLENFLASITELDMSEVEKQFFPKVKLKHLGFNGGKSRRPNLYPRDKKAKAEVVAAAAEAMGSTLGGLESRTYSRDEIIDNAESQLREFARGQQGEERWKDYGKDALEILVKERALKVGRQTGVRGNPYTYTVNAVVPVKRKASKKAK